MSRTYVVVALAVLCCGCARVLDRNPLPYRRLCSDNQPIKILQDARCPIGICGYTCEPDRWQHE